MTKVKRHEYLSFRPPNVPNWISKCYHITSRKLVFCGVDQCLAPGSMWWVDLMVPSLRTWRRQLVVGRWYTHILQHLCVHFHMASDYLHPFFRGLKPRLRILTYFDHLNRFWFCTPPARFSTLPGTNGHLGLPCRKGEAWPLGMWNENEWNILLVNNWSAGWCLNGKLWGLSDILVPHRKNDEKRYLSRWISISKVAAMFITSCCLYFVLQSDCAASSEMGQIWLQYDTVTVYDYSHL